MAYTAGPFDSPHVYLQWGGKLPGNEQWSCGMRFANTQAGVTLVNDVAFLNAAATALTTYHTGTTAHIAAPAKLSFVKANVVDIDGHYIAQNTNEKTLADLPGGGAAIPPHPNQVALVISMVTGFSRGPAHRGRYYMPLPNFPVDVDGLISFVHRNSAKGAAFALLNSLNAITPNLQAAVFSRKLGAPAHRLVTNIEVGRVLDTQRRRRRSLIEAYTS